MQLIPYIDGKTLATNKIVVHVNPEDQDRADNIVLQSSTITVVKDQRTYEMAREVGAKLKNMLNEISASEKAAKQPFTAVSSKITQLARDVGSGVKLEHARILALCSFYVAKLEAEEAERKARLRKAQAEAENRIIEARKAAIAAQSQPQADKAQLAIARAEVDRQTIKSEQEQIEQKIKAPQTRITHPWKFEVVDPELTLRSGGKRLLRIEPDILSCQDAVRAQLETDPDKEPTLPGIRITRETKVFINATI
jgi:hypothetical protein